MSLRGLNAQTGQWYGLAGTNCHDATPKELEKQSGFTKSGLQGFLREAKYSTFQDPSPREN
jgi:hypothetical protein